MDIKAKDLADYTRAEIESLSVGRIYESDSALYGRLAELAGLSRQTVRQFHMGTQPNLGIETLDKLICALKTVRERLRAA